MTKISEKTNKIIIDLSDSIEKSNKTHLLLIVMNYH